METNEEQDLETRAGNFENLYPRLNAIDKDFMRTHPRGCGKYLIRMTYESFKPIGEVDRLLFNLMIGRELKERGNVVKVGGALTLFSKYAVIYPVLAYIGSAIYKGLVK